MSGFLSKARRVAARLTALGVVALGSACKAAGPATEGFRIELPTAAVDLYGATISPTKGIECLSESLEPFLTLLGSRGLTTMRVLVHEKHPLVTGALSPPTLRIVLKVDEGRVVYWAHLIRPRLTVMHDFRRVVGGEYVALEAPPAAQWQALSSCFTVL